MAASMTDAVLADITKQKVLIDEIIYSNGKINHGFCLKVQNDNSISRQRRAIVPPKTSKNEFLSLLGDNG